MRRSRRSPMVRRQGCTSVSIATLSHVAMLHNFVTVPFLLPFLQKFLKNLKTPNTKVAQKEKIYNFHVLTFFKFCLDFEI
jgi:hypothetical protein